MAMKLFISQPMRGLTDEEILAVRNKAKADVEALMGEEVEVLESFFQGAPVSKTPLWYLGESIKLLGAADVIYFVKGWENNRGCRIEHMCAIEYGKSWLAEDEPPMIVRENPVKWMDFGNKEYMAGDDWPEKLRNDLVASGVAEKLKWIPVTERMPHTDKPADDCCRLVMVRTDDDTVTIGYFDRKEGIWYYLPDEGSVFSRCEWFAAPVVEWAPLEG